MTFNGYHYTAKNKITLNLKGKQPFFILTIKIYRTHLVFQCICHHLNNTLLYSRQMLMLHSLIYPNEERN